jgi:hypothetical protein
MITTGRSRVDVVRSPAENIFRGQHVLMVHQYALITSVYAYGIRPVALCHATSYWTSGLSRNTAHDRSHPSIGNPETRPPSEGE